MALIHCPNCGESISEKATKCVHCGYVLKEEPVIEKRCSECGAIITDDMEVCPTCGCPIGKSKAEEPQKVEVTNVKLAVDKKKTKGVIAVAIAIVLIIGAVFGYKTISANKAKKEYAENYKRIVSLMIIGAGEAESACNLIHDVWYNTIYEKDNYMTDEFTKDSKGRFFDDFNTSLMLLMISDSFVSDIDDIKSNQESVQKLMKDMKNPPEEYKGAYDDLKAFYDSYTKMVNLAVDPTGNLSSYTSSFNDADTETLNCYKACQLYLED